MNIFNESIIVRILSSLFFVFAFLLANIFVIVSIIVDNLPKHNVFDINTVEVKSISILLPLALSINTAVIIPKFVDNCYKCIHLKRDYLSTIYVTKYRSLIILLLRSVSMIVVPIISSVFLIQNCGNYWVKFWNQCDSTKRDQFNVHYSYVSSIAADITEEFKVKLLDSSQICNPTSLNNVQWDKCIRSFSSQWSLIITQKLCAMILLPFVVLASKYMKFKLRMIAKNLWLSCKCNICTKYWNRNNYDHDDNGKTEYNFVNLKIDLEYANILTMLETMIIWCPISPLIAPLTLLSIYSNYFAYHHAIHTYHWSVYPFDNHVKLPIHALWISIVFSQMYICCFMFWCFENVYAIWIFAAFMLVMNVFFLIKYWWCKRCVMYKQNVSFSTVYDV